MDQQVRGGQARLQTGRCADSERSGEDKAFFAARISGAAEFPRHEDGNHGVPRSYAAQRLHGLLGEVPAPGEAERRRFAGELSLRPALLRRVAQSQRSDVRSEVGLQLRLSMAELR